MTPARPVAVAGLSGRTLRYAEVVPASPAGGPRLRRLGAADFEADVERAVFVESAPEHLQDVTDALVDGLGGTEAASLVVVAHPAVTTSFFTPLPLGLDASVREGQLRQEAALLADLSPTMAVRAQSQPIRIEPTEGGAREWFHTVHVSEAVHARLSRLAEALGLPEYEVVDTTRAAALAAGGDGLSLVVGAYEQHTEVAVSRDGVFLFGTHGPSTAPADTAYFALAALQQAGAIGPDVDRFLVYGDDATNDRLEFVVEFVGRDHAPLNPFARFGRQPDADAAELAAFGPVLGAAR